MGEATRVSVKKDNHKVEINYRFGDNLEEATKMFGADAVYSKFKKASINDLQQLLRRHIFVKKSEGDNLTLVPRSEDIQEVLDELEESEDKILE